MGAVLRGTPAQPGTADAVRVIVQKTAAADPAPELAVRRLGGQVTRALPIVAGFAATVPAAAVDELARLAGVRAVTPDDKVRVQGAASTSTIKSVYPKVVRADAAWKRGVTGRGVTVAVLDTGVASGLPDLAGRLVQVRNDLTGRTEPCKNLSGELDCNDRYGHGTFIAGLVAGNGASSGGKWKGVAPEASILSVKAAGADGSADVSNILAAIQWVVSFKDRYNIRVLNLSLGTDSRQDWKTDPLNYAVERAWAAGMTVVVAASNEGPAPGTIAKPADDPWVVTVGATDDRGTAGVSDDRLPDFSGRGPTAHGLAKPDVAAPGAHVISLRAPGSTIDTRFPNYVDGSYRQGSGTSMATGVVSGAVALMLQANPGFTPDRVKYALAATARDAASTDPLAVGAG
ncbi:MAG TPA: S8 family peptidase, partial [Actinomycetota bacterium]|nr:S8 family peptidase [Actinomycetota bacterium]